MPGLLEHLRSRPHDERRAIAGGIAIAVMAILLVVWFAFFTKHIALLAQESANARANSAAVTSATEGYQQAKDQLNVISTQAQDSVDQPIKEYATSIQQLQEQVAAASSSAQFATTSPSGN